MINVALLWYLLVPLFLSCVTVVLVRKWVKDLTLLQIIGSTAIGLLISASLTAGMFYLGTGSKTSDVEVLNGAVVSKERDHGFYLRPYECRCSYVQSCSGSGSNRSCYSRRECDTCYEDRYTVTWSCDSTIGSFQIEHLDTTSRSVYNTPDPERYTIIKNGDPVSRTHGYTNYIKAVPETIFRPAQEQLRLQYAGQLPAYPDNIFDIYRINRVVPVGVTIPNLKEWNEKVSQALTVLGPLKQANIVIVITNIEDPNYFYALQDAWLNGKKNDVIVVISAPQFPGKAGWVNIMSLTKDNIFQVKLRDRLLALDALTVDAVVGEISTEIRTTFQRREMSEFKYLEAEIDPPTWVMVLCMILNFGAYIGFWIFIFTHRDTGTYGRFGQPHMRDIFRGYR